MSLRIASLLPRRLHRESQLCQVMHGCGRFHNSVRSNDTFLRSGSQDRSWALYPGFPVQPNGDLRGPRDAQWERIKADSII